MSCKEVEFVKQERNSAQASKIDLTVVDSDSDIEPEVDKIADVISVNINAALKNSLQPFVSQYNSRRNQHQVISSVLKQLPEFQKLVIENAELKLALNNIKNSIHTKNEITLEVKEKQTKNTSNNDNDSVISTVSLESDTDNTITSCINDLKKRELVESFYNAIEEGSDHGGDTPHPFQCGDTPHLFQCGVYPPPIHPETNYKDESTEEQNDEEASEKQEESNEEHDDDDDEEEQEESNEEQEESNEEQDDEEEEQDEEEEEEQDDEEEEQDDEEEEQDEEEEEQDEEEEEQDDDEEEQDDDDDEEQDDEEEEQDDEEEEQDDEEEEQDDDEEEQDDDDEEQDDEEEEQDDYDEEQDDEEEEQDEPAEEQDESGEEQDDDEEEVYIVELEIDGKTVQFYTNDDENGDMYKILEDDDIGDIVGEFKNGEAVFHK